MPVSLPQSEISQQIANFTHTHNRFLRVVQTPPQIEIPLAATTECLHPPVRSHSAGTLHILLQGENSEHIKTCILVHPHILASLQTDSQASEICGRRMAAICILPSDQNPALVWFANSLQKLMEDVGRVSRVVLSLRMHNADCRLQITSLTKWQIADCRLRIAAVSKVTPTPPTHIPTCHLSCNLHSAFCDVKPPK